MTPLFARQYADENLKSRDRLVAITNETTVRWASRLHRFAYFPGVLSNIIVHNMEKFGTEDGKAPIIVFAHKKLHDILTLTEFMLARPMEFFFKHTIPAQGGLFGGIYPYRDWVPSLFKGKLSFIGVAVAKKAGAFLNSRFRAFNCHPVYRRFRDLPSRKSYESRTFAGEKVTGLDYDSFLDFTRSETQNSIQEVEKDIIERNNSLVIFPEGGYKHDGTIGKFNLMLVEMYTKSEHPLVFVSQSYDELCPDRLGRIDCLLNVCPVEETGSPSKRGDLLEAWAADLQKETIIVAGHLIAVILDMFRKAGEILEAELKTKFYLLCSLLPDLKVPFDLRLLDSAFQEDRIRRFVRSHHRWFRRKKGKLVFRARAMYRFKESERTISDLEWNRNHAIHILSNLEAALA